MPEIPEDHGERRTLEHRGHRFEQPLPVAHVRALLDAPADIREQHRAHVIDLARFLSTTGARIDPAVGVVGLRQSEQRKVNKRRAIIEELKSLIPDVRADLAAPSNLDHAARLLALES